MDGTVNREQIERELSHDKELGGKGVVGKVSVSTTNKANHRIGIRYQKCYRMALRI